LIDRGIVTAKYLTDHTTHDVAHSGATVLDSHQLPYAITQIETLRADYPGTSSHHLS
jgi:hypothetical protein